MEKAKISKTISKKNKPVFTVTFDDNKAMTVPANWFSGNETFSTAECEVERKMGQLAKIVVNGKEYNAPTPAKPAEQQRRQTAPPAPRNAILQNRNNPATQARAPYNFIPLNEKVVPAEEVPPFDRYHPDRYTGYIAYDLDVITPLYILGGCTSIENGRETRDFFAPGNRVTIPGSSIRGMIRNLVEIISHGRFINFENKRLYYRAVGEPTALGRAYRARMLDESDYCYPKINAGILRQSAQVGRYEIVPDCQYYRVEFATVSQAQIRIDNYQTKQIYFKPANPEIHRHRGGQILLKYAKVNNISTENINGYKKGYLLASGQMPGKHMHWIISEPDAGQMAVELRASIIEDHLNDKNRTDRINLVELVTSSRSGVPCFYIAGEDGQITSFGHTGMFRLAYEKTIGEHIPEDLQNNDVLDIPEAIFGKAALFASRVSFEDAKLISEQTNVEMGPFFPKILSTPKPTTFQHYLKQNTNDRRNLEDWNSNASVRGHKLYWHRNVNESPDRWQANNAEVERRPNLYPKRIKPVKRGTKFKGEIRFENLSAAELGVLLYALDLPKNHYHKLGTGKPLGFGTVKITTHLVLTDRQQRYSELFSGNGWYLPVKKQDGFKESFEEYMKKHIEVQTASLWELPRLKALKIMLDWSNTEKEGWLDSTRYMEIERQVNGQRMNEYKNRDVLPKPEEIIRE